MIGSDSFITNLATNKQSAGARKVVGVLLAIVAGGLCGVQGVPATLWELQQQGSSEFVKAFCLRAEWNKHYDFGSSYGILLLGLVNHCVAFERKSCCSVRKSSILMCTLLPWPCGSAGKQPCDGVGHSLNSLKGGYIEDYTGNYYRGY